MICVLYHPCHQLATSNIGLQFFKDNVQDNYFYTSDEVERLITEAENTFAICLEGGDKSKAMKKLRVPPLGGKVGAHTHRYADNMYMQTHVHTHTHTHTYTHTHTHHRCMQTIYHLSNLVLIHN